MSPTCDDRAFDASPSGDGTGRRIGIIGGGPAGCAAAITLVRAGHSVDLFERTPATGSRDETASLHRPVCGGCLNAYSIGFLASIGVEVGCGTGSDHVPGQPLLRADVWARGRCLRVPLESSVAIDRRWLDPTLRACAAREGVRVHQGVNVTGSLHESARTFIAKVSEASMSFDHLIAADGLGGRAIENRSGGRQRRLARRRRIGMSIVVPHRPARTAERSTVTMVAGTGGYFGLAWVDDDHVDLAAAIDPHVVRVSGGISGAIQRLNAEAGTGLDLGPMLAAIEQNASIRWRGTSPLLRRPSDVAPDGILRIGDSAGYAEPFTGEGIAWAFRSGLDAAALLNRYVTRRPERNTRDAAKNELDEIAAAWRRICRVGRRRHFRTATSLGSILARPRLLAGLLSVAGLRSAIAGRVAGKTGRRGRQDVVRRDAAFENVTAGRS